MEYSNFKQFQNTNTSFFYNYIDFNLSNITFVNDEIASSVISLKQIFIGIFLYSLTLWTIIGNIFVWVALCTNKQLKQGGMSNYLIGNLALSDLLLGVTVLPFSATSTTFNNWIFGTYLCDIWLSIDVLCCTASIWGLLVIAIDRYIATNHPIMYRRQKNSIKTAIIYCTISWIVSLTISIPPFVHDLYSTLNLNINKNEESLSKNLIKKLNDNTYECVLFYKPSFVIASSLGSFYIPCILMLLLYSKVFMKIRAQKNLFKKHNYLLVSTITKIPSPSSDDKKILFRHKHKMYNKSVTTNDDNFPKRRFRSITTSSPQQHQQPCISRTEARITKTLAIIICCFILCWMPFFTTYIIRSQININDYQIPVILMDVFIWLGYFNSALNPILYAILNRNFRIAFKDILACKCFFKK